MKSVVDPVLILHNAQHTKFIAYFNGVYGPFASEEDAELKAKVAGWRSYDICSSEAEALAIVESEAQLSS
jgi:hypothetical protein